MRKEDGHIARKLAMIGAERHRWSDGPVHGMRPGEASPSGSHCCGADQVCQYMGNSSKLDHPTSGSCEICTIANGKALAN